MQTPFFNSCEDTAQGLAAYGRSLIRPNHQHDFTAAAAPFLDGLIAPPDDQKALSLDRYFFTLGHKARDQ